MKNKQKPDPRLATLPMYIIKSGQYFINTHTGELKHQDSIEDWLPKDAQAEHAKHELILQKRYDLR